MEKRYSDIRTDEERALYGVKDCIVENCEFSGEADGESALKETRNLKVSKCRFLLRYPLWHTTDLDLKDSYMAETCRAPLWYGKSLVLKNCDIFGTKALRECDGVTLGKLKITSDEFGWKCKSLNVYDIDLTSAYPFFMSEKMYVEKLKMKAKYSFQYVKDAFISDSYLDTKDAFWHSENVTVKDSVIKGEYLGWYSKNLTLINCKIIGTQPLCYAKNLKMIDCETENFDLAFERSDVDVIVKGRIDSVKNPSGRIVADEIGEVIEDEYYKGNCSIETRKS